MRIPRVSASSRRSLLKKFSPTAKTSKSKSLQKRRRINSCARWHVHQRWWTCHLAHEFMRLLFCKLLLLDVFAVGENFLRSDRREDALTRGIRIDSGGQPCYFFTWWKSFCTKKSTLDGDPAKWRLSRRKFS